MRKKQNFVLREILDEYILIPTGNTAEQFNGIVTLNETALFIYEIIENVASFEELIEMMKKEYDVDEKILINDVVQLLTSMLENNLIEPTEPEKGW